MKRYVWVLRGNSLDDDYYFSSKKKAEKRAAELNDELGIIDDDDLCQVIKRVLK